MLTQTIKEHFQKYHERYLLGTALTLMTAVFVAETANYMALRKLENTVDEYAYDLSQEGINKKVHEILYSPNVQQSREQE